MTTSAPSSTFPKAPASVLGRPRLGLIVVYPAGLAGARFPLEDGLVLGRGPGTEADEASSKLAVLADATVSRQHARVSLGPSGFLLTDLGSRNGTSINSVPLREPSALFPQMVCRFGDVLCVVDELSEERFDASAALPGTTPAVVELRGRLPIAASDGGPVLIVGETGTGKERLAAEVHRLSERTGPLVAVNCAELAGPLIESQLFGHERGAFTGALQSRAGLFAAAEGGTLFLDEIGEVPLELQAKLLRVLEEREVRPVGSLHTKPIDVRIVAATNRDLHQAVERGEFRRDLAARLSLWELRLPPFRHRRQDLLAWLDYLARLQSSEAGGSEPLSFAPDAAERIVCHSWLDNARGLNGLVRRLLSLGSERTVGLRALHDALPELSPVTPSGPPASSEPPSANLQSRAQALAPHAVLPALPSRDELLRVFQANQRSVRATAKHFKRDRRQIYRWLESYGIKRD